MKKIAFCFLIYDIINLEYLWYLFFKNVDKSKYNIYIHYKNNVMLKYFNEYKLKKCVKTEYAKISLVYAQNLLLEIALKDNNTHYIFVSGSCVPLKSFNYIYDFLDINYSYFNMFPKEHCFPRCNSVLKYMDIKYIQKASQWCILNKKHSEYLISVKNINYYFDKIYAPDEHVYISMLFLKNYNTEIMYSAFSPSGTTFTNWFDMMYEYKVDTGLKNYKHIDIKELRHILYSKSLFGRKFLSESLCCFLNNEYIKNIM